MTTIPPQLLPNRKECINILRTNITPLRSADSSVERRVQKPTPTHHPFPLPSSPRHHTLQLFIINNGNSTQSKWQTHKHISDVYNEQGKGAIKSPNEGGLPGEGEKGNLWPRIPHTRIALPDYRYHISILRLTHHICPFPSPLRWVPFRSLSPTKPILFDTLSTPERSKVQLNSYTFIGVHTHNRM